MMVNVVDHGTGTNGAIAGIKVAGKTGTAQQGGGRRPHAWFVSFAPADNPRVAVAVIIENAGYGGANAAPVAGEIVTAAAQSGLVQ